MRENYSVAKYASARNEKAKPTHAVSGHPPFAKVQPPRTEPIPAPAKKQADANRSVVQGKTVRSAGSLSAATAVTHLSQKENDHFQNRQINQTSVFIAISTTAAMSLRLRPVLPTTRIPCSKQSISRAAAALSICEAIEPSACPCRINSRNSASL